MAESSDKPNAGKILIWVAIIGFLGTIISALISHPEILNKFSTKNSECSSIIEQSSQIVKEIEKRLPFLESEKDSTNHLFYLQKFKDISNFSCENINRQKDSIDKTFRQAKTTLGL